MKQFDLALMKLELEKSELLKELGFMSAKKMDIEEKLNREKEKLKNVEKSFGRNETVNVAFLYTGFDNEKIKKANRELEIVEKMSASVFEKIEVIDEKIKVIKEEMLKVIKEKAKRENKKFENDMLDLKIIKEGVK